MLDGKKTIVTAVLIAIVTFAKQMEWITQDMANDITNYLIGGGLVFLRMGMASEARTTEAKVEIKAEEAKIDARIKARR